MSSGYRVLLITSEPGCGKSTLAKRLIQHLYDQDNDNSPVILYIELLKIINVNCLLTEHLQKLLGSNDRIHAIKNGKRPILLVLDGYDELSKEQQGNLSKSIIKFDQVSVEIRMIITCRQDTFAQVKNYREFFSAADGKLLHYSLLPFTPNQIEEYIKKYVESDRF